MATTDQQNALKDAMARAKQIAAKLQQQQQGGTGEKSEPEEKRKRTAIDTAHPTSEPEKKKNILDMATDPKLIAQQVAKSLVQKAHTGPMLVEEITIPNKLVGLVIGKGGEMINKLQSESGAKVQVAPDPPSNMAVNERQITITGNAEAVGKAKSLIAEIQNSGKVPERLMAGTLPGDFSIEMNIAKGKVGLIIGKGGENIKSLQERAGCKMVLLQTGEYANTPEKPLRISGEQSAVMYGKQLVLDLLTSKELEGMNPGMKLQEGQGYKEIHVPREVVGLVIGAKGVNIQQIQMETGCRIRFNNDMEGPTKTAMLSGDHQQVAAAEVKLNELISANWGPRGGARPNWGGNQPQGGAPVNLFNSVEGPRPGWGPPQGPPQQGPPGQFPQGQFPQGQFPPGQFPPGQGPPGQGPFGQPPPGQGSTGPQRYGDPHIRAPVPMGGNSNLPPGHKHVVIHLPANKCGLVIGKGGETIKFIQNETSVDIDLDRDVPETFNYRVFQVKGTEEQIEKALSIIREKANDPSIVARPIEENQGPEQSQWGAPSPWAQPQNQQWNQQQQWPGQQPQPQQYQQPQQPPWSQEPVTQPGQPAQPWNQQPQPAPGWNQPPTSQPSWDPQQQQQQQQQWPNVAPQGQWPAQQQWAQPGQQYPPQPVSQNQQPNGQVAQPVPNPVSTVDPTQTAATQVTGQPDYSAAWALYYQQQQQYYQQYAMQQPGAVSSVPAAVSATTNTQASATSTSADTSQAQAMAEYQAKLAEYYKSLGQQPPQ